MTRSLINTCILLNLCLAAIGCRGSSQTAPATSQSAARPGGSPPGVTRAAVGAGYHSPVPPPSQDADRAPTALAIADSLPAQQSANQSSPLLEDVEKSEGPFQILGQNFTVVSVSKHIKGKPGPDSDALISLEIRDTSRSVVHHEQFAYNFENGQFMESCSANAELLKGSMNNYIVVSSECLPDAPMSGGPWEIFGPVNGKLALFGGPIYTQGEMVRFVPGTVTKIGTATQFGFDGLEFKVWTGNFNVTLPVRLGMAQPDIEPGIRCITQSGHGMVEIGCNVPVEARRSPADQDTFLRLFEEPQEDVGAVPAHVVIHSNSTVEFLAASARMVLVRSGGSIGIEVADDPWLKVRVDGKVGWIHTQEDFVAVGLPPAG